MKGVPLRFDLAGTKISLVFVGLIYFVLGICFILLANDQGYGEVNPVRLVFLLGSLGIMLSGGICVAALTLTITAVVQLQMEGADMCCKGESTKSIKRKRLFLARILSVFFVSCVVLIHSFTMISGHWPTNASPKCPESMCVRDGKCQEKFCGNGFLERNCDCTCDIGFSGPQCLECAPRFENGSGFCSRCTVNYTGVECQDLAYGLTEGGVREGFRMTDELNNFPRCQEGRCGKDCEEVDPDKYDRNGKYTFEVPIYSPSGKSCKYHSDCSTEWCQGLCRGTNNVCYSNSDCGIRVCENRFCSLNPRWNVCAFQCSDGFLGDECQACPGQANRDQTESNPEMMTFPCSEKNWDRKGQCGLNLVGEPKCRCDFGWTGYACECKGVGTCTDCAEGYLLNRGACEKCPVMYNGATDRFQACGGYIRGRCQIGPQGPECECSWPFAVGSDGACSECQEPFEKYTGGCQLNS